MRPYTKPLWQRHTYPSSLQDLFINFTRCTALGKLSVDYYRRHPADAQLLGSRRHLGLVHVQDFCFARGTGDPPYGLNCFVTRWAASAKDFNFAFVAHKSSPYF
jgi:hypothetical protein